MDPIMIDEINEHTTNAVAGIDLSPLQTAIANVKASADAAITAANNAKAAADAAKSAAQTAANNASGINKIAGDVTGLSATISAEYFMNSSFVDWKTVLDVTNIMLLNTATNTNGYACLIVRNNDGTSSSYYLRVTLNGRTLINSSAGGSQVSKLMLPVGVKISSLKVELKQYSTNYCNVLVRLGDKDATSQIYIPYN